MTSARLPPATDWGYLGAFTPTTVPLATNKALQFVFIEATSGSSLGGFYYSDGVEWIPIGNRAFSWRATSSLAEGLLSTDLNNGIAFTANAGSPVLTLTSAITAALPDGASVLLLQEGTAQVSVEAGGGVTLRVRSALGLKLAGQYALATLILRNGVWYLCGDVTA